MSLASTAASAAEAGALPRYLGVRFDAGGKPLRCSGNTVVAHVLDGPGKDRVVALQERLAATEAGGCFAWLPSSSLHMTVFDGVLHDRRDPGYWPAGLGPQASAAEADAFMAARLRPVPAPPPPFHATVRGAHGLDHSALGLTVTPREESVLRAYRDRLAATVGLEARPGHATYPFHITLAYLVAWPVPAAAAAFDADLADGLAELIAGGDIPLGPAEYCLFEDMTHFAPQT